MKNENSKIEKKSIHPFQINQAVVAMQLGKHDEKLLNYFKNFCHAIPVSAACFIHVVPDLVRLMESFQKEAQSIIGGYSFDNSIIKTIEKTVDHIMPEKEKMKVNYEVLEGDPLMEILKMAESTDAGLTVIGQRTDAGAHGIFAHKLARHSKGNALIVPDDAPCSFDNLLVPIDFSPNSVRAFQTALSIRKQVGEHCRIVCLNVYSLPDLSHFKLDRPLIQFKNIVESNIKESFEAFIDTYSQGDKENIEMALVEKDLPGTARYIYQYMESQNSSMLIIGAKGHSKIHRLLIGSTTEKLLQLNKKVPCLVVK